MRPERSTPDVVEERTGLEVTRSSQVSPELRECVALRYFADLPLEEIAQAQDVPVGTVKSRLHGAVKRLRTSLDQGGFERHD